MQDLEISEMQDYCKWLNSVIKTLDKRILRYKIYIFSISVIALSLLIINLI